MNASNEFFLQNHSYQFFGGSNRHPDNHPPRHLLKEGVMGTVPHGLAASQACPISPSQKGDSSETSLLPSPVLGTHYQGGRKGYGDTFPRGTHVSLLNTVYFHSIDIIKCTYFTTLFSLFVSIMQHL